MQHPAPVTSHFGHSPPQFGPVSVPSVSGVPSASVFVQPTPEGECDGDADGLALGLAEGDAEGDVLGEDDGDVLGEVEGELDGASVEQCPNPLMP